MIIRSQNKAVIINFEKVDTVCLGGIEEKSVITFTDAQVVTLGTYSTEEKAIKVLDMIAMRYYKANQYFESSGFVENVVFEMPADEDVEV